ncbi:MAG: sugar phosphate isomerase/epimerase [Limnochordia bacterium]|nr:sugar phosphate isomerase/epimerase [Limnochordia bacterium]MDD4517443.1 sugar phosphate isomerase/epimerase [Limnochordia bacterium]
MKLGVFNALFSQKNLVETLDYIKSLGLDAIEVGTGNYPGNAQCPVDELLADSGKLKKWKQLFDERGIQISALSCHGNPLHPQEEVAKAHRDVQRKTILLAEKLGIDTILTFSGCPGEGPNAKYPNWVTCPWPDDFLKVLEWQWEEAAIPFWQEEVQFAKDHGVEKIGLEMHPGFLVYNPETLLKLRNAVGPVIGANYDPSHLFWQGMDPIATIRELGDAIYHVHAKDCRIDPINTARNGVLDTKHYGDEINRSWIFRTVGYGHSESVWNDIVSNLRLVGYDYVLSIEHEDSLMTPSEGFEKAVQFLKNVLIYETAGEMWWA